MRDVLYVPKWDGRRYRGRRLVIAGVAALLMSATAAVAWNNYSMAEMSHDAAARVLAQQQSESRERRGAVVVLLRDSMQTIDKLGALAKAGDVQARGALDNLRTAIDEALR